MADDRTVRTEDVCSVASRVSWGAVFAGAVMTIATGLVLFLLGGSIGLSVNEDISRETMGTAALIWNLGSMIIAFFVGGFVASRCTVGENRGEAVIHGVMTWATAIAILALFTAVGVQLGISSVMGVANVAQTAAAGTSWEAAAERAGISQETINNMRQQVASAAQAAQEDEEARRSAASEAETTATRASWLTLFGVMLSMAAGAIGGYVGAGPTLRFAGVTSTRPIIRTPAGTT